MTCFWTGILTMLSQESIQSVFKCNNRLSPSQLVTLFKQYNTATEDVLWNGNVLGQQELKENVESIKEYDVKTLNNGYLCSCCEPFLLLLCQLFRVNVHHNFNGVMIKYTYVSCANNNQTLICGSNRGHFWGNRHR
jgi:hypothetical protein